MPFPFSLPNCPFHLYTEAMNDQIPTWLPTTPQPTPPPRHFPTITFIAILLVSLLGIAIPTIYILPQLNRSTTTVPNTVQIPELFSNCAFFYQLCPTSSLGITSLQSVGQLLTTLNSPLQQAGPLLYSSLDNEQSTTTPPDQILLLIAAKYNINPFLLLTLSEMEYHLVTQTVDLKPITESAGESSGDAWFALQHQLIAQELQTKAQSLSLAPNTLEEKSRLKSVKIGNQETKITGNFSLATQVIIEYLGQRSTSKEDFQTKLETFTQTYQQLWGINPAESKKQ